MDSENNDYHISFFKPTNESTRHNRNMILQLFIIWALAIFGFHLLIKALEKPVPEEAYKIYQKHWGSIKAGKLEKYGLQEVSKSALSVLGKIAITPKYRAALDNAISWMAYNIADSTQKFTLLKTSKEFENIATSIKLISDAEYQTKKKELIPLLTALYNTDPSDVRSRVAPLEINSAMMLSFDTENIRLFEEAMALYLIHNRSVLTDTQFLGFPFHYFYTSVFLLILFVGLCWLYCIRTDMYNKKYGIED